MVSASATSIADPISPVRVSGNGRYFVDASGHPVYWLGDTQWELFRAYTPATALRILRDRQAKGFNIVLVMLTGVDMAHLGADRDIPYANLEGELPWLENDPDRPNERYFEHIDAMLRLGETTDQTLVVGIYHQWHRDIITLDKARRWARWVARRYRDAPNLLWSMYPRAEESYIPVCRELAAGLQEGDGGRHLISVHPDPSVASSSFIHGEPWLAFNMIQTCIDYEQIPAAVGADYARQPAKPVVMAEGGYEGVEFGKLQTAREIRQQAYWTQLAGGHHIYGHNDAWTSPQDCETWLSAPGARDLQTFREIMTSLSSWWTLVPDPSLVVPVPTGEPSVQQIAARAADGTWTIAYLGEPSSVTLRLDAVPVADDIVAHWIHPVTGQELAAHPSSPADSLTYRSPEGWEDAVLLVKTRA